MITRQLASDILVAFAVPALVFTILRLCIRRFRRWGWDDLFAVIAALALAAQATMMYLRVKGVSFTRPRQAGIDIFYVNGTLYLVQEWCGRISIACSLLRICIARRTALHLRILVVYLSLAMGLGIFLFVGYCKHTEHIWSNKGLLSVCKLHPAIPYVRIATGIIADVLLVAMPLRMVRHIKSEPKLRRRLQWIFSTTLLLSVACIVQAACTITGNAGLILVSSSVQGFLSVVLCSLPVLVAAALHLLNSDSVSYTGPSVNIKMPTAASESVGSVWSDVDHSPSPKDSNRSAHPIGHERTPTSFFDRWSIMDLDEDVVPPDANHSPIIMGPKRPPLIV